MAIFHYTVKIVGRSKGKSIISASAYLNGDVMKNEETGRISYYTSKREVVYTSLLMCENAPQEWLNVPAENIRRFQKSVRYKRADNKEAALKKFKLTFQKQRLWNEVLRIEKSADAQLGRSFEFSLPKEWNRQEQIDYTLRIAENIKTTAMQSLSEEDFSHLLADLIENAFIAMSDVTDKKILINLGRMGNHLSVEISDNGQPFLPEIFQDFGLKAHTTHAGNGGSGIGLMDIWKLKKKYRASLVITEYAPGTYSYTKQISLIFDAKKHYIIQTYRRRELGQIRFRDDLYIFPC